MAKDKRSFFERITGAVKLDDDEMYEEEDAPVQKISNQSWLEETPEEGELNVDVYQDSDSIVIKTMVAGVKPDDLDVSITRDMVTIKGKRETEKIVDEDNYLHKELYWGSFSRTIVLPQEIDVDLAEAVEKHGLLIIKLPKINKNKQTRIKVKG